jgi:tripartite-type tricarboxylate transporter receptor subunit TctC
LPIEAAGNSVGLRIEARKALMQMRRRTVLGLAAGAAALPFMRGAAWALDYPTRPVRILVGFAAGSGLDLYARLIAQFLTDNLGQSFVVENRVGAGSNVAAEILVHATADGYTLFMASAAQFTNATLYSNLSFNFIRDTAPVASVSRGPFVIVTDPSFPAKTAAELIAYAKARPGKVTFGTAGVGTLTHVSAELFKMMAGIDMVHVPYRGEAQAIVDMLAGQLSIDFSTLGGASEFIKSGKLRALAVTGAQRSPFFPDIPAVSETLPGYDATPWSGICAPKATPVEIVAKLHRAINAGLADPKMKAQFALLGSTPTPLTTDEYGKAIVSETEKWGKVIRAAGIKIQ